MVLVFSNNFWEKFVTHIASMKCLSLFFFILTRNFSAFTGLRAIFHMNVIVCAVHFLEKWVIYASHAILAFYVFIMLFFFFFEGMYSSCSCSLGIYINWWTYTRTTHFLTHDFCTCIYNIAIRRLLLPIISDNHYSLEHFFFLKSQSLEHYRTIFS